MGTHGSLIPKRYSIRYGTCSTKPVEAFGAWPVHGSWSQGYFGVGVHGWQAALDFKPALVLIEGALWAVSENGDDTKAERLFDGMLTGKVVPAFEDLCVLPLNADPDIPDNGDDYFDGDDESYVVEIASDAELDSEVESQERNTGKEGTDAEDE
ncbi:hypothetical protein EK21DRAFT_93184 [Setomelanomma holmii]|uniref:Uncharacterized protein n=1 Tax=Setomelanomma holmii TaxID=210430 RepID=A0A9P4H0Q8_9PLEO|nr:hypothetical protein EK21DRAFT_93184 [Setomelanomma holmii]